MKKLFLILFISLPFVCFGQKVMSKKTKEIFDLKEKQSMYCSVVLQASATGVGFFVSVDELGYFLFVDENGKELEFKTIVSIMNYMHQHGWEYLNNIGGTDGAAPQYYFKKRSS